MNGFVKTWNLKYELAYDSVTFEAVDFQNVCYVIYIVLYYLWLYVL